MWDVVCIVVSTGFLVLGNPTYYTIRDDALLLSCMHHHLTPIFFTMRSNSVPNRTWLSPWLDWILNHEYFRELCYTIPNSDLRILVDQQSFWCWTLGSDCFLLIDNYHVDDNLQGWMMVVIQTTLQMIGCRSDRWSTVIVSTMTRMNVWMNAICSSELAVKWYLVRVWFCWIALQHIHDL